MTHFWKIIALLAAPLVPLLPETLEFWLLGKAGV